MNSLAKIVVRTALSMTALVGLVGVNTAYANDCATLQSQKNLILAANGYCFSDASLQAQYGKDCHTKRPKFTDDAVRAKFESIENKLKAASCPKID